MTPVGRRKENNGLRTLRSALRSFHFQSLIVEPDNCSVDLKSADPFWPVLNGLLDSFPPLEQETHAEVAVIGAGITGALIADRLSRAGLDVVVLDRREAAHGSTSASTCLLQYEIDTPLQDLIRLHGERHAVQAYKRCALAIDETAQLISDLGDSCGFQRTPSCCFASIPQDIERLRIEATLRQHFGLDAKFLSAGELEQMFDCRPPAALWTDHAAEVDGYRLAYRLLSRAVSNGARVFDRTEVTRFDTTPEGWTLQTDRKSTVRARQLIMATGYEATPLLPLGLVSLHSTFAIASQPLQQLEGWPRRCLIWETARPYHYGRMTEDGRAIFGGEDERFRSPRARDALVEAKSLVLQKGFESWFPRIPIEVEYAWAGTFAETKDGLPLIGRHPDVPHALFALGYGGNGIVFSVIAAQVLHDAVMGRTNPDAALFSFDRLAGT
jgi:glycine/D-amino acid oxidase-like deaminating enzyme